MRAIKVQVIKKGEFFVPMIAPWKEGKRNYQFGLPLTVPGIAKKVGHLMAHKYARTTWLYAAGPEAYVEGVRQ